jgi:hypothetical protein
MTPVIAMLISADTQEIKPVDDVDINIFLFKLSYITFLAKTHPPILFSKTDLLTHHQSQSKMQFKSEDTRTGKPSPHSAIAYTP